MYVAQLFFGLQDVQLMLAQSQDTGANELVKAVDQMLNDLGQKFSKVSSDLFERSTSAFLLFTKIIPLDANIVSGRHVPTIRRDGSCNTVRQ